MNDKTELQKPDWEYWRNRGAATLPEAVLLSLDIEPRQKWGNRPLGNMTGDYDELSARDRQWVCSALDEFSKGLGSAFTDRLSMAESKISEAVKSWR